MEMNWVYGLIVILYGVLLINRLLYSKLEQQVKKAAGNDFKKYSVLKEDFFTTVAIVCIIGTVIINILCIIGGTGLNVSSIIVTLLILGLAFLSGWTSLLGTTEGFELGDYRITREHIKKIRSKKYGGFIKCYLEFEEEQNGYEGISFYCRANELGIIEEKLNKQNES